MRETIEIPEGTTIGYLTTKVKDQLLNTILDFPQLKMLSAPTRTIRTDKLGKSKSTTIYAA
ncbi:hypothetical protein G9A89_011584 [Geosiphon pyriformis]|nr:hypothetical protein G9A89_011584 [Geosiphon pyriformis]